MDVKTIFILTAIINAVIFISLSVFIKFSNIKTQVLKAYAIAKLFQFVVWALLILRGAIPDILSIGVSNILIITGFGIEILAITTSDGENLKQRIKVFSQIAIVLAIGFLSIIYLNESIRIAYVSFVFFVWNIVAVQQFFTKNNRSSLKIVIGVIYFVFSFN